jgi:hypothetical protein
MVDSMASVFGSRFVKLIVGTSVLGAVVVAGWWSTRLQAVTPDQHHLRGKFGPLVPWPLIPLQVQVLPDGRVLSYGSDGKGAQGSQEVYDVWDPRRGTGADAHLVLANGTGTDIFCSGALILPASGQVLLVGGDRTLNGVRNYSSPDINFFDYKANVMTSAGRTMERPRWYPTVMTLANGEVAVLGGRLDPDHFAPLPEIYSPTLGWRTLPNLDKDILFGSPNWNYPRVWQTPKGDLFSISRTGDLFRISLEGQGSYTQLARKVFRGHSYLPSLMYAPGKILSMRVGGLTYDIDINGEEPVIKQTAWASPIRFNAMATVMADGRVYINGGGLKNNDGGSPILANRLSEIWDPATGKWLSAAVAQKDRLYHSVAMLMQDGTILTGAGGAGAKGQENNLNAEIYYPPYLFKKDGSGDLATRPQLTEVPDFISWAKPFTVKSDAKISRFTLIKMGSATHAQVYDQRFMDVSFSAQNGVYSLTAPSTPLVAPPGYYFLFGFDEAGVPSTGRVIRLENPAS